MDDLTQAHASKLLDDFIQQADSIISQSVVPSALAANWDEAVALYQKTKDIRLQWMDQDIDPQKVTAEMAPLLSELDATIKDVQIILSNEYGFELDKLIQEQQASLVNVYKIFGLSVTPTPGK